MWPSGRGDGGGWGYAVPHFFEAVSFRKMKEAVDHSSRFSIPCSPVNNTEQVA